MQATIRIGTRESELALWQAKLVQSQLAALQVPCTLVPIKSEGDIDQQTPLYEMGVQGIFTRSLDIALLNNRIDIAVHSMKDVPVQLPAGIAQAAVLKRDSPFDLLVFKKDSSFLSDPASTATIATSSIRRKAQWLHRYPAHQVCNLRGNVNTRLEKLERSAWNAAIFAEAGLSRINKVPHDSMVIDWMLPAPAQGAILVVCRADDSDTVNACRHLNDADTDLCTKLERQFLRALLGGCSTPISAYARVVDGEVLFNGNILSPDGKQKAEIEKRAYRDKCDMLGTEAARDILARGGNTIMDMIAKSGIA